MPTALTKEIPDTDEIEITIEFSAEDPIEQAFKKSLLDSFLPQNQDQYVKDGLSLACVDGFEKEGKVIVRGLASDINYRLHSPPLEIPEDISSDPSKLEHFWKDVGDVIFEQAQCQRYRERENQLGSNVTRSQLHEAIFRQAEKNKAEINDRELVNQFVKDVHQDKLIKFTPDFYFNQETGKAIAADKIKQLSQLLSEHPLWKDGGFQQKLTALTAEAASSSTQHMLSQLGGPVESENIEETQKEEYPRPLAPEPPVDDEEYDSTETRQSKLS